jgi:hypothetical protein
LSKKEVDEHEFFYRLSALSFIHKFIKESLADPLDTLHRCNSEKKHCRTHIESPGPSIAKAIPKNNPLIPSSEPQQ